MMVARAGPWQQLLLAFRSGDFLASNTISDKVRILLFHRARRRLFLWLGWVGVMQLRRTVIALLPRVAFRSLLCRPTICTSGVVSACDSLEVLEGDHHYGDVVERLAHEAVFEDAFDAQTTVLMHTDPIVNTLLDLGWSWLPS